MTEIESASSLARIVLRGLAAGKAMEIDGLGTFFPDREQGCRFEPRPLARVFVAYVEEDQQLAEEIFEALEAAGFAAWMDIRRLLPGQNWPRAIECAIETSDFFLACFSGNSVSKRGGFQAEIRYALNCAWKVPLDEIFIVPVRLDACPVPRSIRKEYQYVDLFPDRTRGLHRLFAMMRREMARRRAA